MFGEVFRFEMTYRLRQPVVYVFAALFFFMAFMAISTDSVRIGGGIGNVARNAPYVIIYMLTIFSAIGLVVVTILVASAVNRDRDLGTRELIYSTSVTRSSYLGGRFTASTILALMTVGASALGIMVSAFMPWQDPDHLVFFRWSPYLYALCVFVIPNLIVAGAVFYSVATLSGRAFFAYAGMIAFFACWGISQAFMRNLQDRYAAALADPLGLASFELSTRYWTVVERNTLLPPLTGHLVLNRVLWLAVGALVLAFTLARFRMTVGDRRGLSVRPIGEEARASKTPASAIPSVQLVFTARTALTQWLRQTREEIRGVLRSLPFVVIMIFGVANLFAGLVGNFEGTTSYPVTRQMLRSISGAFELFLLIVIVLYSGEMVWRERQTRMHELFDALPIPNWIPLTAKLAALAVTSVLALTVAMLTTIAFQVANGYFRLELGVYCKGLFIVSLLGWLWLCALALFVQVLANHKYLGYLVMVLYFVAMEALPVMGFEHHLYLYGTTPNAPYSDMNGYGHLIAPLTWFNLYWGLLALGLVLAGNLLWVRGTDNRVLIRLRLALERMTRGNVAALATAAVGFLLLGGWIFYNTNVLNEYHSNDEEDRLAVLYEQRYKHYDGLPQPRLTDVKLEVDIDPAARSVDLRGDLRLVNKTDDSIDTLHVLLNRDLRINSFTLPDGVLEVDDREVGYRIYSLGPPLAPGASLAASFDLSLVTRGFVNGRSNLLIVENGTFFDNAEYVPQFGYRRDRELEDPDDRKDHGLPPRARLAPMHDLQARRNTPLGSDADRITFEATVSTSADQTAIAPGRLERTWLENGRRYFHYKTEVPIFNFYAFLSGRYAVARDTWNAVDIAVYYHPTHRYNVDRMIESVKKSLAYCTANFSAYQHDQIRIIEFPGYRSFAQSLPGTIPFSESAHFVDDVRDPEDIDMVFYITAHEVAHQWWGHQVCGGAVQGWSMLIESLAQYSALMVMEKEFGRQRMEQFLAYELDRYLSRRSKERISEMPLMTVENQPYIHYYKGSLVMYALRDYIGEDNFNQALRRFVAAKAYQAPPYTTASEFLEYVRDVVPDHLQYLIEDMFETITLYDNRAEEATCVRTDDGKYKVRLVYQSRKMRADGLGVESEMDHRDWIEIGVFGERRAADDPTGTTLYLEKHQLRAGTSEIELIVDDRPTRAGIDPRHLLIDRVPGDNVRRIAG